MTTGGTAPTRPLASMLPFDDAARDDQWFENVVRDLLRRSGYERVEFYGAPGDRQEGIDIRADRDGRHYGVQVKKRNSFTEADTEAAIEAATYPADGYILALSRRATVGVRRAIDQHGDRWQLLDHVALSDLVRDLPHESAVEYIEQHFHPAHIETFLGRDRATTFLDRDRFFAPFLDRAALVFHGWARVGPETPLEAMEAFLTDDEQRVLLVSAPLGVGKTKLLYDATADTAELHGRRPYFVAPAATITPESLRELRSPDGVIFVDEAQDVQNVGTLLGHVLNQPNTKLVLTAAAGERAATRDAVLRLGFQPQQVRELPLERLGRADTIALVRQVIGYEEPEIEEAIVLHFSDSALTTLLSARLARERRANGTAFQSETNIRDLIRALYRDIAIGNVSEEVAREDVRAVLEVLAATGPAKIEDNDWLIAAASFLGWDVDRVLRVLDAIDDTGVLLRRGFHYTIAPELLRQSIFLGALVARGRATGFALRLLEHFPYRVRFLRNLSIADIESQGSQGPALFDAVWERICERMEGANSLERLQLFDRLEEVAYFKPGACLRLVVDVMTHPATNDDEQEFARWHVVRHDAVLREVPRILRAVMLGDPETIGECVRLLWQLGRDQEPSTFHDPIKAITEAAEYDPRIGSRLAEEIVRAVGEMIATGEQDTARHSLLDLIAPVLARDLTMMTSRHTHLEVRRGVVDVASAMPLRDRAVAIVASAARGNDARRADKALQILGDLLREPMNQWRLPSDETRLAWDRERLTFFDVCDEIVTRDEEPLRELRIVDILPWFANHSLSGTVRRQAQALLRRLDGNVECTRFRVLIPTFLRFDAFVDITDENIVHTGQRLVGEFIDEVAREYRSRFSEPTSLLDDVAVRLAAIEEAGLGGTPQMLFHAVIVQDPEFGAALLNTILERGDARFYRFVDPLLGMLFLNAPSDASSIAERLLESGSADAVMALANAVYVRGPQAAATSEYRYRLLERLLQHPERRVRETAARAATFVTRDSEQSIIPLVIAASIGRDSELADTLFMALPHDVSVLDDETVARLLDKLHDVDRLKHWPLDFLGRIAPTRPRAVFGLFAARLRNDPAAREYYPVPYVDITLRRTLEVLAEAPDFESALTEFVDLYETLPPRHQYFFETLMGHIGEVAPASIKSAISRALASTNPALQRAAHAWMHALPHSVVTGDLDFVVRSVERAVTIGPDYTRSMYVAVLNALTSGAENIGMYEATPGDLRMQRVASAALDRELSARAREFFETLLADGQRSEERSIRHSEDTFGPQ